MRTAARSSRDARGAAAIRTTLAAASAAAGDVVVRHRRPAPGDAGLHRRLGRREVLQQQHLRLLRRRCVGGPVLQRRHSKFTASRDRSPRRGDVKNEQTRAKRWGAYLSSVLCGVLILGGRRRPEHLPDGGEPAADAPGVVLAHDGYLRRQ
jgi:hypothetical protein